MKCPRSDEAAWRIKARTRKPTCPFFPHQNPDVCPRDAPVDADSSAKFGILKARVSVKGNVFIGTAYMSGTLA